MDFNRNVDRPVDRDARVRLVLHEVHLAASSWAPSSNAKPRSRTGLAAAEKGQNSLVTAKVEVDKIFAAARDQARGIVDQANTRATASSSRRKADGEAARKAQLEAARAEIGVEINRAREELRGQVAKIAVAGAEKVLGREIDANAHRDLLGKLAAEL